MPIKSIYNFIGSEKIIKRLLETNTINVNAVDKDGYTALDAINTAEKGTLLITWTIPQVFTKSLRIKDSFCYS